MSTVRCGSSGRLTFGSRGIASFDPSPYSSRLVPSFTTFNFKITHRLTYVLKGEIAGEKSAVAPTHHVPIKVLLSSDPRLSDQRPDSGPLRSDSWIRPPEDDELEAPPAFAEVEHKLSSGQEMA